VFVGDASGHGLPAAFVSTMAKMSLYHHTRQELESSDLMQRINIDIASNIRTSHYLTCVWCLYDSQTRILKYVRAGHPRPVVVKPGGESLELDAPGSLVGILDKVSFTERSYQCSKGERVFLFTDGVFAPPEGASARSITQSIDPFRDLLSSCSSMPFKDVIPWLKTELAKEIREDDYSVLVMEVC
jgi:serine phosphatase RsbU (regulator of sigma subunit)